MAIWGGEGAKSRIERDLFVLGSRLTVEVQLTVVTISLTTRERRTEPGDRVRAPQSVEGIFFSICLFLFSIRFFYFSFFLSIYIYIYVRIINISNIHRNRSCQESNHGRAVARARRGTLSQHSGFSNQFHSQFHFPKMRYLSILVFSINFDLLLARYMFIIRTKIINETGWIEQKITSTSWLLRRQSIFQGTTTYIYIYNVRLITLNCTV